MQDATQTHELYAPLPRVSQEITERLDSFDLLLNLRAPFLEVLGTAIALT